MPEAVRVRATTNPGMCRIHRHSLDCGADVALGLPFREHPPVDLRLYHQRATWRSYCPVSHGNTRMNTVSKRLG